MTYSPQSRKKKTMRFVRRILLLFPYINLVYMYGWFAWELLNRSLVIDTEFATVIHKVNINLKHELDYLLSNSNINTSIFAMLINIEQIFSKTKNEKINHFNHYHNIVMWLPNYYRESDDNKKNADYNNFEPISDCNTLNSNCINCFYFVPNHKSKTIYDIMRDDHVLEMNARLNQADKYFDKQLQSNDKMSLDEYEEYLNLKMKIIDIYRDVHISIYNKYFHMKMVKHYVLKGEITDTHFELLSRVFIMRKNAIDSHFHNVEYHKYKHFHFDTIFDYEIQTMIFNKKFEYHISEMNNDKNMFLYHWKYLNKDEFYRYRFKQTFLELEWKEFQSYYNQATKILPHEYFQLSYHFNHGLSRYQLSMDLNIFNIINNEIEIIQVEDRHDRFLCYSTQKSFVKYNFIMTINYVNSLRKVILKSLLKSKIAIKNNHQYRDRLRVLRRVYHCKHDAYNKAYDLMFDDNVHGCLKHYAIEMDSSLTKYNEKYLYDIMEQESDHDVIMEKEMIEKCFATKQCVLQWTFEDYIRSIFGVTCFVVGTVCLLIAVLIRFHDTVIFVIVCFVYSLRCNMIVEC